MNTPVAVLGAGSWGTALAVQLARNGVATTLWGRTPQAIVEMATTRRNARYLPDLELPDALQLSAMLEPTVRDAGTLLLSVPSHAFDELLGAIATWVAPGVGIAWATKGFDPGSGRFLHELVAEHLPGHPAAVVTGPSFAREVALGLPTALTVHSSDAAFAHEVAQQLHSPRFRAYTGNDVLGAELGGAMKNVLAVATGVADGMQMGLNARAGLITRGLAEMLRLGAALGSRAETLMGLAGLGDLALTCTSRQSRNLGLGIALGEGSSLAEALAGQRGVVEGAFSAAAAVALAQRHGVAMPISEAVDAILNRGASIETTVALLLARPLRPEDEGWAMEPPAGIG